MAACMLSMEFGLTGPVMAQTAACATSIIAFHDALRLIQSGEVDVVLTGGSEAPILPVGIAALGNMGALSKRNDDPTRASRPFDRDRDGFVLGEGGGVVVVELLAHALARGATPIAEILGGALTADAFHISAPEPTGRGATRAMTMAREHAGVTADEVDWVVAHGTSTPLNDVTETRAIKASFGPGGSEGGHLLAEVDDRAPRGRRRHRVRARGARRDPRPGDLADGQPREPGPAGMRPRLRAADGAEGEGRDGHGQRLWLRRPERGRDLPALHGVVRPGAGRTIDAMGRIRTPAWLQRGLEAGVFAALLSLVTVLALEWEHAGPGPLTLPSGIGAGLALALPVFSLGVLGVAYPVALAATKGDAILGAIVAWIVGADLLAIVTVAMGQQLLLVGAGITVPLGVVAGVFAAPAALGGLLAAELFTPLGFGRRAGRFAAIAAAAIATPILLFVVPRVA